MKGGGLAGQRYSRRIASPMLDCDLDDSIELYCCRYASCSAPCAWFKSQQWARGVLQCGARRDARLGRGLRDGEWRTARATEAVASWHRALAVRAGVRG